MPNLRDRVKESTTTTGMGNITLAGAAAGFLTFNNAIGVGPYFTYCMEVPGSTDWEIGIGHLTGSTTLVRDTVLKSSNSNALVNFSAGTKQIFLTLAADRAPYTDELTGAFYTRGELTTTPTISAGALTLNVALSTAFRVNLNASVTSLTISNPIASGSLSSFTLILDITGAYTITWPASVKWANGSAPTLSSVNGKVDILSFLTTNGGTTWYGFVAGKNF